MSDNTPNAPSDDLTVLRAQLTEVQAALEAERTAHETTRKELNDCRTAFGFERVEREKAVTWLERVNPRALRASRISRLPETGWYELTEGGKLSHILGLEYSAEPDAANAAREQEDGR